MTNEITAENIHTKTDEEILGAIGCFGRMWNPWEQLCNGVKPCMAQARCVHHLAMLTLPQEALERGAYEPDHEKGTLIPKTERLDLNEMASEMQTDARALSYALAYAKDPRMGLPVIQPNGTLVPSMSGPPQIGGEPLPVLGEEKLVEDPKPEPEPVEDLDEALNEMTDQVKEEEADAELESAVEVEEEAETPPEETKMASKKKSAKKASAKKAPAKKAKATSGPKPLPPAPTAEAPAKKEAPKKEAKKAAPAPKKAKAAKEAPAAPKKTSQGAAEVFAKEFERDMARSDQSQIPMGTVLEKHVRETDEHHKVKLTEKGWSYNGKLFSTLGKVQQEIAGIREYPAQTREDGSRPKGKRAMVSMSASRYFNLPKVIEELKEAKSGKGKKGKK